MSTLRTLGCGGCIAEGGGGGYEGVWGNTSPFCVPLAAASLLSDSESSQQINKKYQKCNFVQNQ